MVSTFYLMTKGGTHKIDFWEPTNATAHIAKEEAPQWASNLVPNPMYTQDSSGTQTFDYGGVVRIITLTVVMKDTAANIATFVQNTLANLANGNQTGADYPYIYVSPVLGTVNVKFLPIDGSYRGGDTLRYYYTLKMVESKA